MGRLRNLARVIRDGRAWRRANRDYLLQGVYHRQRNADRAYTDEAHLVAAANWLERAQDASGDGGVSGRYFLDRSWSSSYPETTGYILPTFLSLRDELGDAKYLDRARRCLDFLLPLQLESGAFPGGEVAENRTKPSLFNTAQIINGLVAWHRTTGDERAMHAARRAADWMLSIQDADGAFRRHCYGDLATTYSTHASCWLAELGVHSGDGRYLEAAGRHLDWALTHADPRTGWFDKCGFGAKDHEDRISVTHTIAYTLRGVLFTSEALGREDGVEIVRRAAERIARRLEISRRLPGVLDAEWRARAEYVCLTGNAQMALIWLRLHERNPDLRFLNAALKALEGIKRAQSFDSPDPGIRGGIAGSDPVWGGYIYNALPNWAAKFFIDALLQKRRALLRLAETPSAPIWAVPADVPTSLPPGEEREPAASLRVVLYTSAESRKPAEMLRNWGAWGFRPQAIVVEHPPEPSALTRIGRRLREDGVAPLLRRFRPTSRAAHTSPAASSAAVLPDPSELAGELSCPIVHVTSLNSEDGLKAVRSLAPDLAVHAGAGILRAPLLGIPRLGTLNAHMGLLPHYRGMNVAEWAAMTSGPVGCTVHLVDPGIDTGPILAVCQVDCSSSRSVADLRSLVDRSQLALLGEVLRFALRKGHLPPGRTQTEPEGRQYFRMHDELKSLLEARLLRGPRSAPA
jgi:hypothetical protein